MRGFEASALGPRSDYLLVNCAFDPLDSSALCRMGAAQGGLAPADRRRPVNAMFEALLCGQVRCLCVAAWTIWIR